MQNNTNSEYFYETLADKMQLSSLEKKIFIVFMVKGFDVNFVCDLLNIPAHQWDNILTTIYSKFSIQEEKQYDSLSSFKEHIFNLYLEHKAEIEQQQKINKQRTPRIKVSQPCINSYEDTTQKPNIERVATYTSKCFTSITLDGFNTYLKNKDPKKINITEFEELVKQLDLSKQLIESHVKYEESRFHTSLIDSSDYHQIALISWLPGQERKTHIHYNFYSIIRVYQGILSHSSSNNNYIHTQSKKDELIVLPYPCEHELANNSLEKLITLHFQFFPYSINNSKITPEDEYLTMGHGIN